MTKPVDDAFILKLFSEEKTKERAFELLVEKYKMDIYYNIRRIIISHHDTDDITQNVFIKIWRHLGNFRGESSLKTWINRICVNESLTFLDKKKKTLNLYESDYTDHVLNTKAEERHISTEKIEQLLQSAIMQLPEKQRVVFTMRYYHETPYEEMAKLLTTSVGALKASYHFATKKVEDFLSKH